MEVCNSKSPSISDSNTTVNMKRNWAFLDVRAA
jgi:hypothetical protein